MDVEECEDYMLAEEQNKEVKEIPSEQNENKTQESEIISQNISERNGE